MSRLETLLERYTDREATPDEVAELQALLQKDPAARAKFWAAAEWQALFYQWGGQEWGRVEAQVPPANEQARHATPARKIIPFPLRRWAIGAAAAAAAIVLAFWYLGGANTVGALERSFGAVWEGEAVNAGGRLATGQYRLKEGLALLTLDRGARILIEAPANFEIRGNNHTALHAGRIRVHAPPSAHGFTVETAQFTAVDVGTEFGCEVALNGTGELHVFSGAVDFQVPTAPAQAARLKAGEARQTDGQVVTKLTAQPLAFLDEAEIARRELQARDDRMGAWRIARAQLSAHPALLLHWDFETPGLPSGSTQAAQADGRWAGKRAATFQRPTDGLSTTVPGSAASLTFLTWVRADSLRTGQNPLVMSARSQAGAVHWYLYGPDRLGVGVLSNPAAEPPDWQTYHSDPLPSAPARVWAFVACVLDGTSGDATHYWNGKPIGARRGVVRVPLRLGELRIGHGDPRKPGEPPTHLTGTIDEIAILSTALSSDEIARLYEAGRPR
jgi:hypothetical protein